MPKTKDELLNDALLEDVKEDEIFEEDKLEEGENPFAKKDKKDKDSDDDDSDDDDDDPVETKKKMKKEKKEQDDKEDDDDDKMKETEFDGVDNGDVEGRKGTKKTGDPKAKSSKASPKSQGESQDSKGKNTSKHENLEINVEENVKDLLKGTKFSDEYTKKVGTIFESAVREQVRINVKAIEEELETESKEQIAEAVKALEDKVEQYIDYVSKEYMKENKLAIEQGVRAELVESFIVDFKELCEKHSIEISDDELEVVATAKEEKEAAETKLDEQIKETVELQAKLNGISMQTIVDSLSSSLVETDKEKYTELIQDIIYINEDDYKEKLSVIREHYFNVPAEIVEEDTKKDAGTDKDIKDETKAPQNDNLITASVNTLRQHVQNK